MIEENNMISLEDLRQYENKWVALVESNGAEIIVASGEDATGAKREAENKGFKEVVLYRVSPADRGYIPSIHVRDLGGD